MTQRIEILCDSLRVSGPRQSDNQMSFTFTTGEYEKQKVAQLLTLPDDVPLKVIVEVEE